LTEPPAALRLIFPEIHAVNDKWWSVLIAIVMVACGALFVVAPVVGWWLPERKSDHAWDIDYLFYVILAVTGFFFVLTEALLVFFMFRYCTGEAGEVRKPSMWTPIFGWMGGIFNSAQRIEMAWTVVPALILLYIAFAQVDTWADVKYKTRLDRNVWAKDGNSDDANYRARLEKALSEPIHLEKVERKPRPGPNLGQEPGSG
jgi:heme/copper-type cytochrome/quinol oxidase subunit 2